MADNFVVLLDQRAAEIKALLPSYLNWERFRTNAVAISRKPELRECRPDSLVRCAVDAANRGLEIGGADKHCAVVPFKSKKTGVCIGTLIVQWQGKAFLWHRAGAITKLVARVVYVGDKFELVAGDEDRIVHIPDIETEHPTAWLNDIKNIVGAYAIAWLPSGEKMHAFVGRNQLKRLMEWVRKKNDGELGFGWQDWLPEMCCKTAVHRLGGFIQPPGEFTEPQREAWERSRVTLETEAYELEEPEPDDLPTPAKTRGGGTAAQTVPPADKPTARNNPPEQPPSRSKPKVVEPEVVDDSPVSMEEADDLLARAKDMGLKPLRIASVLFESCGVDEIGELKRSQVPRFLQAVEATANG